MHNPGGILLLLAAISLSAGCGEPNSDPPGEIDMTPSAGILVSDDETVLRVELERADRRFARDVRQRGLDAWVEAFAEDGSVLPATGPIATGPEAIRALFAPVFGEPGFEFSWAPVRVEVAPPGRLGYTFGNWESVYTANGEPQRTGGRYATVWRRKENGTWEVLLDIGNTRPAR